MIEGMQTVYGMDSRFDSEHDVILEKVQELKGVLDEVAMGEGEEEWDT